jgi:hypothetical protein
MRFLKRLLLAVTTVTLLSTLAMLAAPKTLHAVVATLVRDVDNPARANIVASSCFFFSNPAESGDFTCPLAIGGSTYTVPTGQRLVIQQVASECLTPPGANIYDTFLSTTEEGVEIRVPFVAVSEGVGIGGRAEFVLNQTVQYYADPGTTLTFNAGTTDSTGSTRCELWVNGYTLSYP